MCSQLIIIHHQITWFWLVSYCVLFSNMPLFSNDHWKLTNVPASSLLNCTATPNLFVQTIEDTGFLECSLFLQLHLTAETQNSLLNRHFSIKCCFVSVLEHISVAKTLAGGVSLILNGEGHSDTLISPLSHEFDEHPCWVMLTGITKRISSVKHLGNTHSPVFSIAWAGLRGDLVNWNKWWSFSTCIWQTIRAVEKMWVIH